ncbi:hypothetical protein ZWY2020_001863 [Hordeum vulgare]|nr:hypothetical protein ZWY2020_001863 [Hordeum vulgare]
MARSLPHSSDKEGDSAAGARSADAVAGLLPSAAPARPLPSSPAAAPPPPPGDSLPLMAPSASLPWPDIATVTCPRWDDLATEEDLAEAAAAATGEPRSPRRFGDRLAAALAPFLLSLHADAYPTLPLASPSLAHPSRSLPSPSPAVAGPPVGSRGRGAQARSWGGCQAATSWRSGALPPVASPMQPPMIALDAGQAPVSSGWKLGGPRFQSIRPSSAPIMPTPMAIAVFTDQASRRHPRSYRETPFVVILSGQMSS